MREIKFRCWDGIRYTTAGVGYNNSTGELLASPKSTSVLEQFTGLLDKNGKEIYEGDVVFTKWEEFAVGRDDGSKSIVHMCQKLGGWGTHHTKEVCGKWCMHLKFHCFPKHTEVIGNVHENPELLK